MLKTKYNETELAEGNSLYLQTWKLETMMREIITYYSSNLKTITTITSLWIKVKFQAMGKPVAKRQIENSVQCS